MKYATTTYPVYVNYGFTSQRPAASTSIRHLVYNSKDAVGLFLI